MTITIYAGGGSVDYADDVEFGTQDTPANPYFLVSWRRARARVKRTMRTAARKAARQT